MLHQAPSSAVEQGTATPKAVLHDLLMALFTESDLRRWIHGGPESAVYNELPGEGGPLADFVFKLVAELARHGMINDRFFARLRSSRPLRHREIDKCAATWANGERPAGLTADRENAGPDGSSNVLGSNALFALIAFLVALLVGILARPGSGAPLLALGAFLLVWVALKWSRTDKPSRRKDLTFGGIGAYLVDKGSGSAIFSATWAALGWALGALAAQKCTSGDLRTNAPAQAIGASKAGDSEPRPEIPRSKTVTDVEDCPVGQQRIDGRCKNSSPPREAATPPLAKDLLQTMHVVSDCRQCEARIYIGSEDTGKLYKRVFFHECPKNEQDYHHCTVQFQPGKHTAILYDGEKRTTTTFEVPAPSPITPVLMLRSRALSVRDFPLHPKWGPLIQVSWNECLQIKLNIPEGEPILAPGAGKRKNARATFKDEHSHFFLNLRPGGYSMTFKPVPGYTEPGIILIQLDAGDWVPYHAQTHGDGQISFLCDAYCRYYLEKTYIPIK